MIKRQYGTPPEGVPYVLPKDQSKAIFIIPASDRVQMIHKKTGRRLAAFR